MAASPYHLNHLKYFFHALHRSIYFSLVINDDNDDDDDVVVVVVVVVDDDDVVVVVGSSSFPSNWPAESCQGLPPHHAQHLRA